MQVETVFPAADGTPMPAVLTVPDGADGPVPGVLMIYEIFGMSDEMRGSFALLLARTGLYKVSAPFYGRPPDLPRSCPVVASFGGRDVGMRGAPEKLTADLDALDVPHDVKVYPDAGHSFFTRTPGLKGRVVRRLPIHAEYHEASAQDAHRRVVAFFEEHLGAP
jgi:carboxymethylenebutenolidase